MLSGAIIYLIGEDHASAMFFCYFCILSYLCFQTSLHHTNYSFISRKTKVKTVKRKVQGMPQSQTAALSRHQEEEEVDKTKQAQNEQTYEKH